MVGCWELYIPIRTLEPSSEMKLGSRQEFPGWNSRAQGEPGVPLWREKPSVCPTQCPMSAWLSRLAGGTRHHSVLCEGGHSHLKSFSPQSWVVSSDACGDRSTVSLPWMLGLPAALSSSHTLPCKLSCFDLPDPQLRCLYPWRPVASICGSLSCITAWKLP